MYRYTLSANITAFSREHAVQVTRDIVSGAPSALDLGMHNLKMVCAGVFNLHLPVDAPDFSSLGAFETMVKQEPLVDGVRFIAAK